LTDHRRATPAPAWNRHGRRGFLRRRR
jgi:hypothetical protein